ncbi:MAG: glycosyltransferase [Chloroflexi bacterium]|nr:glycosyltransferase [Chloroflexota bacterium]
MKILFLTQIVPYPPDSGPKVKTYHVLRYLAEQGHQVTLASFVRAHEKPALEHLAQFCAAIQPVALQRSRVYDLRAYVAGLQTGLPFLITRDDFPAMRARIAQLASEPFDIIHADQLNMAQYALQFRRARNARAKLVFDAHNAVYEIVARARQTAPFFARPILALEARRLEQYEGGIVSQFDQTLAVSEIDRRALISAAGRDAPIAVIPIAVDCAQLPPVARAAASQNILTVSTLFYPPNADGVRWFLREVLPRVRAQMPNATVAVVGPRPPRDLVELGARDPDHIHVPGYVPDLQPSFARAALMVVPVRAGSGMRVRILEALARGMPIVTTTTGVEGIDAINGEHLLVADESAQFADAVVRLLKNPSEGERLARNGRRLVEEKYDWQVALPKLQAVYQSLCGA